MADAFTVLNLSVTQKPGVGPGGTITQSMVVTYKIGTDGPFMDIYPAAGYTAAEMQAGIQKRVADLRALRQSFPGA